MIDKLLDVVDSKTKAGKIQWEANPDIRDQYAAHVPASGGTQEMELRIRRMVSTVTVPRKLSWPLVGSLLERFSEPLTDEKVLAETILDILRPDTGQRFHIEATKLPDSDRRKLQHLFELVHLQVQEMIAGELIPELEAV